MLSLGMKYTGSFQSATARYNSENPLEEVWSRVAQIGSTEFVRAIFRPEKPENWDAVISYSVVRIRQAVEFREAARQSTLLTSPLPLYYSFLNLLRALMALGAEVLPEKGHGLKFTLGRTLLESSASVCKGTFKDYLSSVNASSEDGLALTLEDALSRIIEIAPDYSALVGRNLGSLAVRIRVDANMDGEVLLRFPGGLETFRTTWADEFPALSSDCTLEPQGNVLRVADHVARDAYTAICNFCSSHLEPELRYNEEPYWYLIRHTNSALTFPRPAYYFVGMYILGNVVRYEPELMLEVTQPDSRLGWFLKRFVRLAERYYPQLMLRWLHNREIYF